MRKEYPSDVTREQFGVIEAQLRGAKKTTRPPSYDLYDIFCALLYVLKEGCTWRALPHDFPKWENVYYHFRAWDAPGEDGESLLDKVLRDLVEAERKKNGRDAQTTMIIVDSRSVKNADTAQEKGYDAGKKLLGQSFTSALIRAVCRTQCSSPQRISATAKARCSCFTAMQIICKM